MDFESQIEKIAKDIRDREDKEMEYELVKRLSHLLIANGVTVKTTKYNLDEQVAVKEASSVDPFKKELVIHYGISIDGLDFTEHDKKFKDEIRKLKHELGEKCNFEIDRLVKLPFDPLETANMLINAKEEYEPTSLEKALCKDINPLVDKYSIDDLEQIAEHLLVYCKHNREDGE